MRTRLWLPLAAATVLAGCGGSGGGDNSGPQIGSDACSVAGQRQFVLDTMRDVYFWVDDLPSDSQFNINDYATAEDLLDFLTSFQPLDTFSFINSAEADSAFFGEGQFAGFGFSSTRLADNSVAFTRVFSGSPAANGGIERGQTLVAVDGRTVAVIDAAEGLGEAFGPSEEGITRTLTVRRQDNTTFDATLTKAVVTIDPVPQSRVINFNGARYGYLEFATFISTASSELEAAFGEFNNQGITDLILDLRYNGGGLVSIANELGDYLGGSVANGLVFSETLFNRLNTASNSVERFGRLAQSMNLSRLVVITTGGTASASELVINSMEPHVQVQLVGADTFGKPVGQVGVTFCEKILRPTAFETVNSLGNGQYFGGLPVDCAADDDLTLPTGDVNEASTAAAIALLNTGSCPVVSLPNGAQKTLADVRAFRPEQPRTVAQATAYAW